VGSSGFVPSQPRTREVVNAKITVLRNIVGAPEKRP
jgi:hypothetical protein